MEEESLNNAQHAVSTQLAQLESTVLRCLEKVQGTPTTPNKPLDQNCALEEEIFHQGLDEALAQCERAIQAVADAKKRTAQPILDAHRDSLKQMLSS